MNAHEVIESYVEEVALKLPRKQRNDVAFELRALLGEELQGRAETAGREADAAMAIEMLRAFGQPADVAARYRPARTIVEPSDGQTFLRATVIGLAVIWVVGLLESFRQPIGSVSDLLRALGHWWLSTVLPSFWWPGVLVGWFGTATWAGRRWPSKANWTPRDPYRSAPRASLVLAILGILAGVFLINDPHWVLDTVWGGRAAPAAYEALTYTESFRAWQAPLLFSLLLLNVPILLAVIARGRWSPLTKRLESVLGLVVCAVMAWVVFAGPVFLSPQADGMFKLVLVISLAITFITIGITRYRRVKPMPNATARSSA